jgi:hypothetical protein
VGRVTLQDLGDLGDFVGGALLVVSLIYLAFQVRQNTVAQRVAAVQQSVRAANDLAEVFAVHPEVLHLVLRGRDDFEGLEAEEQARLTQILAIALRNFALNRELADKGLIPAGICEAYEANLRPFLDSPSGRLWWQRNAPSLFDTEFRRHLDARLVAWAREPAPPG